MDTMTRDPQRKGKESWPPLATSNPAPEEILNALAAVSDKIDAASGSPTFSNEEHVQIEEVLTRAGRDRVGHVGQDPRALLAMRPDPE